MVVVGGGEGVDGIVVREVGAINKCSWRCCCHCCVATQCCCYCCCYCSSCAAVVADTAVATVAVAATDVAVAAVPDEATAPAATTTPRTLPSNENKRAKVNKSRMHLFARAGLSIPSRRTPSICLLHFSITCT